MNDIFSKGGQQQQHAHLKTHYRGHHIAVWLQLIPQLHQPGGDPASYATASSYSNHHRFDRKNTPVEQFYEGIRPPSFLYYFVRIDLSHRSHFLFFPLSVGWIRSRPPTVSLARHRKCDDGLAVDWHGTNGIQRGNARRV
jgi:hypothetical protein